MIERKGERGREIERYRAKDRKKEEMQRGWRE